MTYSGEVLADTPFAYWRMNDAGATMADSSGNARDGSHVNTPTLQVAGATTDGDTAVQYDGVNEYSTRASLPFTSGILSFECWFYWTAYADDNKCLARIISGAGDALFSIFPNWAATSDFYFSMQDIGGPVFWDDSMARPTPNVWHHLVAAIFDRNTPAITVYLDAVAQSLTNRGHAAVTYGNHITATLYLAAGGAGTFLAPANSRIDEVAIYPAALSGARITAHNAAALVFTAGAATGVGGGVGTATGAQSGTLGDGWTIPPAPSNVLPAQPVTYAVFDLATRAMLDELPLQTYRFTRALSNIGGWSATIRHDHPKISRALLEANRRGIVIVIDDTIQFCGIIRETGIGLDEDFSGDTLSLSGDGIFGYFLGDGDEFGRFITASTHYTASSAMEVIEDIIDDAQAVSGGDIGLTVTRTGTEGADIDLSVKGYELNNVGTMIQRIADENDVDFDVDYAWDFTSEPAAPAWNLSLSRPMRGGRKELDFVLGKNIAVLQYDADGFRQANRVRAAGAGDGRNMRRVTVSDNSLIAPDGVYPLLERVVSDKTIHRASRLTNFANARLRKSKRPPRTMKVELIPEGTAAEAVRLGDFTTGDQVRVFADDGILEEGGDWWRVLSYDFEVDENGTRRLTVDLHSAEELE